MCSDPVDPGGEVLSSSVGLHQRHVGHSAFGVDHSNWQVHRISRTKKMLFHAGALWVRRAAGFSGVLIDTKSLLRILFPLHRMYF